MLQPFLYVAVPGHSHEVMLPECDIDLTYDSVPCIKEEKQDSLDVDPLAVDPLSGQNAVTLKKEGKSLQQDDLVFSFLENADVCRGENAEVRVEKRVVKEESGEACDGLQWSLRRRQTDQLPVLQNWFESQQISSVSTAAKKETRHKDVESKLAKKRVMSEEKEIISLPQAGRFSSTSESELHNLSCKRIADSVESSKKRACKARKSSCISCNSTSAEDSNTKGKCESNKVFSQKKAALRFKCQECGLLYYRTDTLLKHMLSHKKKTPSNKQAFVHCRMCGKVFGTQKSLKLHENFHRRLASVPHIDNSETTQQLQKFVPCNLSHEGFSDSVDSLKKHCKKSSCTKYCKKSSCTSCNSISVGDSNAQRNSVPAQRRGKQIYKCQECGLICKGPSGITAHIQSHRRQTPLKCSKCDKLFFTASGLKLHDLYHRELSNISSNDRMQTAQELQADQSLSCFTCGKTFTNKEDLVCHCECLGNDVCIMCVPEKCFPGIEEPVVKHNPEICVSGKMSGIIYYMCSECCMIFKWKSSLTCHLKEHAKRSSCGCVLCGKMLKNLKSFKSHWNKYHNGVYKCGMCDFTSRKKQSVVTHLSSHTNVRPFRCSVCDKSFTNRWSLNRHKILHTGLRPFECGVCKATFADGANRRAHELLHYKDKEIHTCPSCHVPFVSHDSLKRHVCLGVQNL